MPGVVSPDEIFKGFSQNGYSLYADVKLGEKKKWGTLARFDYYNPDTKNILKKKNHQDIQKRLILGVSYRLVMNNMILIDWQKLSHTAYFRPDAKIPNEERWQATLQIKF
ncbi:MAG: hypothetical protein GYA35_10405 [Thermoanaerobaculaceae bacterium]|nr:hypothetical protein [Thermoanaerobaculaceae bacterium]